MRIKLTKYDFTVIDSWTQSQHNTKYCPSAEGAFIILNNNCSLPLRSDCCHQNGKTYFSNMVAQNLCLFEFLILHWLISQKYLPLIDVSLQYRVWGLIYMGLELNHYCTCWWSMMMMAIFICCYCIWFWLPCQATLFKMADKIMCDITSRTSHVTPGDYFKNTLELLNHLILHKVISFNVWVNHLEIPHKISYPYI